MLEVQIGVSARHIHLEKEDMELLFGKGYKLTPKVQLVEENSFVAEERVKLIGPKGEFTRVAIIGPFRERRQVELSKSDAVFLGINAPVNLSGNHEGAAELEIVGTKGSLRTGGVIVPERHVHLLKEDAESLNIKNMDKVNVHFKGKRKAVFLDVIVKLGGNNRFNQLHIDTDEANAVDVATGDYCTITKKV